MTTIPEQPRELTEMRGATIDVATVGLDSGGYQYASIVLTNGTTLTLRENSQSGEMIYEYEPVVSNFTF